MHATCTTKAPPVEVAHQVAVDRRVGAEAALGVEEEDVDLVSVRHALPGQGRQKRQETPIQLRVSRGRDVKVIDLIRAGKPFVSVAKNGIRIEQHDFGCRRTANLVRKALTSRTASLTSSDQKGRRHRDTSPISKMVTRTTVAPPFVHRLTRRDGHHDRRRSPCAARTRR